MNTFTGSYAGITLKTLNSMDSIKDLIPGAIYFLDYGGNTQIIGRFESEDSVNDRLQNS